MFLEIFEWLFRTLGARLEAPHIHICINRHYVICFAVFAFPHHEFVEECWVSSIKWVLDKRFPAKSLRVQILFAFFGGSKTLNLLYPTGSQLKK